MKTTDQIAAEAARRIWRDCGEQSDYLDVKQMTAIIKAAIEEATNKVTKERDDLAVALQRLMKAVQTNLLCGIPEIKTVEDVIRGMRTVADKLVQVSESRAAHASEPSIDKQ